MSHQSHQRFLGDVVAVAVSAIHAFSKARTSRIELIAGHGVLGDAHAGTTVKHRSRVASDPTQPNLRQVHLIHSELFEELRARGYSVSPGDIGENITTRGIELLQLPKGTRLNVGSTAVIEITGLRNPCTQLDQFAPGLMSAVLDRTSDGSLIRKSGVMGIVLVSGAVQPGDTIRVEFPKEPHVPLQCV